jgi:hypothetical protein
MDPAPAARDRRPIGSATNECPMLVALSRQVPVPGSSCECWAPSAIATTFPAATLEGESMGRNRPYESSVLRLIGRTMGAVRLRLRSPKPNGAVMPSCRPFRRRLVGAAAAGAVFLLLLIGNALAATIAVDDPAANGATQKADDSEHAPSLATGVKIHSTQNAGRALPTPVYSIAAPDLGTAETVRIAASVFTSYCNPPDIAGSGTAGSPCKDLADGSPPDYHYTVRVEAHLYQASAANDPSSANNYLGSATHLCTDDLHHCAFTVEGDTSNWNPNGGEFINLDVSAWPTSTGANWQGGQMLELEGDCTNLNLQTCAPVANDDQRDKSQGQLSVVRMGSLYNGTVNGATQTAIDHPNVEIDAVPNGDGSKAKVVYTRPIYGLEPGDVIETFGTLDLDCKPPPAGGCDTRGMANPYVFDRDVHLWWVLAIDDDDTQAVPVPPGERFISADSNENCIKWDGTNAGHCTVEQIGSVTARATSTTPTPTVQSPMYLNLVVRATDVQAQGKGTRFLTASAGSFGARCDPALSPDLAPSCRFTP